MEAVQIIYPGIAMFFLTFFVATRTGYTRLTSIRNRKVSIRYYRLYNEGEEPPDMRILSRHLQNHFEVPPIFYVALLFTFVSESVNTLAVGLAWVFVVCRYLHSWIHLGSNNVTHRFSVFVFSGFVLAAIWLHLLVSLLMR